MDNFRRIKIFIKVFFSILIWINGLSADPKLSENMVKMKAVKDKILNGYDKYIRPTQEGSNTTEVMTGFLPRQILELDEERSLLMMDSYFWMSWSDPRLMWNLTTEYNGYLQLPADMLWTPDLSVYNSHSLQVNPMQKVLLMVYSSGAITWVPPILTQTACPSVSDTTYPNDVITCIIEFGSWVHDGWEVDFAHFEELFMDNFQNINSSHSLQVNPTQQVLMVLHASGHVYWFPPVLTQTECPSVSETPYPNDAITCIIQFGAWVHDGWELNYTGGDEFLHMYYFRNIHPRWELIVSEAKAIRNVTYYEGYDEPYISIDITLPLRRRSPPEIEASRKPCILIMLLTLSIFWLPPNSTKKVLLGGILFLVLNVLLVYVALSTKFPLGVVFAVTFLQSTMYIVVVTILLQVLIVYNLCNLSGPMRPPTAIMEIINGPFGKYACIRSPISHDNIPLDRIQLKEDSTNSHEMPTPRDEWMLFCVALDRLFFVLISITMIAVHHL